MKLYKVFFYSFLLTIGLFPSLMNSADIYENARGEGKIISLINNNLISGNLNLNSTIFKIQTKEEYKDPQIYSKCNNSQKVISNNSIEGTYSYLIYFRFTDKCSDANVYLKNGDEIYINTGYKLNLISYNKIFEKYSDYSDDWISNELIKLDIENLKFDSMLGNLNEKQDIQSKTNYLKNLYSKRKNEYFDIFFSNILSSRKKLKYISPVSGKTIPTKKNIIPGSARPYRIKYTDGIHHGWDIFASKGTPTRALSDGIVIRIVNNFQWSDFDKILWQNLSDKDREKNLDIYRGNQVWLKTIDGNVTFYSHLENIPSELKIGQYIKSGQYLGQVGRSGVPDKEYSDFHLHFETQINPHNKTNNTYEEIMDWQYFGEGKDYETIISEQNKLFAL